MYYPIVVVTIRGDHYYFESKSIPGLVRAFSGVVMLKKVVIDGREHYFAKEDNADWDRELLSIDMVDNEFMHSGTYSEYVEMQRRMEEEDIEEEKADE